MTTIIGKRAPQFVSSGDRIRPSDHNTMARAVREAAQGGVGPIAVSPERTTARFLEVVSIDNGNSILNCREPGTTGAATFAVLLPPIFTELSRGSVTYVYSNINTRVASASGETDENQELTPPILVGEVIKTEWSAANVAYVMEGDGRMWGVDPSPLGAHYKSLLGAFYRTPLGAFGFAAEPPGPDLVITSTVYQTNTGAPYIRPDCVLQFDNSIPGNSQETSLILDAPEPRLPDEFWTATFDRRSGPEIYVPSGYTVFSCSYTVIPGTDIYQYIGQQSQAGAPGGGTYYDQILSIFYRPADGVTRLQIYTADNLFPTAPPHPLGSATPGIVDVFFA